MKKYCFLLLAFLTGLIADAQVVIGLQLPPAGLHLKNQLWNLSLINTGTIEPDVKIEVLLTDASNNQQVLSGASRIIKLKKGASLFTAADVRPVTYNVLNPAYGIDASPVGFLPIGHFNICFQVTRLDTDLSERLAEECETVEIEPVSPPMLMIPYDEEHVESTRPFFTWIAPAPQSLFSNLTYDLVVVELVHPQNSSSAIQQNIPVYAKQNLPVATEAYPMSYPELDTAKTYAWRIIAKNAGTPVASSEIWTFRVKKFGVDSTGVVQDKYFSKLRGERDASYVICTGVLRFEYLNELNENSIELKLTDLSSANHSSISIGEDMPPLKLGQNFLSVDLTGESLHDKHIYQLEVTNSKKQKWYLKLEYRQQ